jgi:ADP-ribosyl-[dinitrogen reductase] hydrolase
LATPTYDAAGRGPHGKTQAERAKFVMDRAHATLLGAAIGDALGATVEFMTRSEIAAAHGVLKDLNGGGWLHLRPGQVTDDTQMSLCIARSIVSVGWSVPDIAARFAAWMKSRPIDIGNTCRRGIRRYLLDGSLEGPPQEGDAGNGAAMRTAPVAISSLGDVEMLDRRAKEQAHVTHHHPLSDAACTLVGRLIHLGCIGAPFEHLAAEAARAIERVPAFRFRPYRGLATTYVVDTMQTVLHGLFATETFEDCLILVVNQGGDADTTGAIAGAIAGAHYGLDAIPRRWKKRLDPAVADEIADLAVHLATRSPLLRGSNSQTTPHAVAPWANGPGGDWAALAMADRRVAP